VVNRMRIALILCLAMLGSACGDAPVANTASPLPALETVVVGTAPGAAARSWDGVVEAVQHAELAAQTSGRVTEVTVDVNDRVAAGAVVLRLTAVEQQAGADAARAQLRASEAAAVESQASYARFAALAGKQYVSRLQLDQLRASRDAAVASRDAARAQLAQAGQLADYTTVRAPFAGIVSARHVEPGESLHPGQALLSIYNPDAWRIEVQVPQSEAAAIRSANSAQVQFADGRTLDAAQVTVFPAADPVTHSVGVRVQLGEHAMGLQPGITAKVLFPIGGDSAALRIPRTAMIQRGEVSGVYVLDGQRLSLRQLRVGQTLGREVEVLSGLKPGELVAADPVAALQALTAQRKALGAAHE